MNIMSTPRPIYTSVSAGSPSPVEDGEVFDLGDHLIRHPSDTFYVKVSGDSMIEQGIQDGDILIVDRSLEPHPSDVVVARLGDGFTVKVFTQDHGTLRLVPANPQYKSIPIDSPDARICGVVTFSIHPL